MKQTLFLTACVLFSLLATGTAYSQQPVTPMNEIYLSTSSFSLNGIDFVYKRQQKNNSYLSIGLVDMYGRYQKKDPASPTTFSTSTLNFSGGLVIGLEKRKALSERFFMVYGPNLELSFGFLRNSTDNPQLSDALKDIDSYTLSPGISYTLGFIYSFKSNFGIGAKVSPGLFYRQTWTESGLEDKDTTYETYFSASSENIKVSLIYSW